MQLEFDIPDDSNGDKNITRKDVVMYLFQNGTWIALPTCATGIKNGRVLYRSESPEFSLFAITINNTPFSQSQDSGFAISPESDTLPKEHNGESGVPIVPDLSVLTTSADKSDTGQPVHPVFSGIMVISIIVISVVLIRHWWMRRRNLP